MIIKSLEKIKQTKSYRRICGRGSMHSRPAKVFLGPVLIHISELDISYIPSVATSIPRLIPRANRPYRCKKRSRIIVSPKTCPRAAYAHFHTSPSALQIIVIIISHPPSIQSRPSDSRRCARVNSRRFARAPGAPCRRRRGVGRLGCTRHVRLPPPNYAVSLEPSLEEVRSA
ncbi:hypothetical protein BD289DRAFT_57920 [Coniella lustricola]|uniref:Uncharacterized protein n=1 Tax=Coniella lustricola TaxID=2025994 RepID=A0A2T3AI93_9PEZI|nr:hypothetical protein BD289DRAFT_57920 [Coniella lustricola]